MQAITAKRILIFVTAASSLGMIPGCANYEVNTRRGNIPGHYIRHEMQEADRAVEAARRAGKDKLCPVEFKAAEDAKNNAYDVFRACHTEEGAALADKATAQANALCPPKPLTREQPVAKPAERTVVPVMILVSEPKAEEKVAAVVTETKVREKVVILAFEDVHFDFDQSVLKPEAKVILKRNIRLLKENPGAKIRIAGYTSAAGTVDYNQKLSERRARSVQEFLVGEGVITPDRLTTIGYGETHPAAYEAAPSDIYSDAAKANIRVLFEIVIQ